MRHFRFLPVHLEGQLSLDERKYVVEGSFCTLPAFTENHAVSRPRELPPKSLSELYVNLSAHTAPIIQPMAVA